MPARKSRSKSASKRKTAAKRRPATKKRTTKTVKKFSGRKQTNKKRAFCKTANFNTLKKIARELHLKTNKSKARLCGDLGHRLTLDEMEKKVKQYE